MTCDEVCAVLAGLDGRRLTLPTLVFLELAVEGRGVFRRPSYRIEACGVEQRLALVHQRQIIATDHDAAYARLYGKLPLPERIHDVAKRLAFELMRHARGKQTALAAGKGAIEVAPVRQIVGAGGETPVSLAA